MEVTWSWLLAPLVVSDSRGCKLWTENHFCTICAFCRQQPFLLSIVPLGIALKSWWQLTIHVNVKSSQSLYYKRGNSKLLSIIMNKRMTALPYSLPFPKFGTIYGEGRLLAHAVYLWKTWRIVSILWTHHLLYVVDFLLWFIILRLDTGKKA